MGYKPKNATEGFMLAEIEYLKRTITEQNERIDTLEEDNIRLNKLVNWYKKDNELVKKKYEDAHSLWQASCYEADYHGMELEEENEVLKQEIKKLESELYNTKYEFRFQGNKLDYWEKCYKKLLDSIRALVDKEKIGF